MKKPAKAIDGFTWATHGGWVKKYRGRTVYCGGVDATADELVRTFAAKCDAIDGELCVGNPGSYREVLSEFLTAMQRRHETGKPRPLSARTLHNYTVVLNDFGKFVGGGKPIDAVNRPEIFARYAAGFSEWKNSGYDSVVSRVSALFRWAERMEYIDRFRPGPEFQRPAKAAIRDDRLLLSKSFTGEEFAKLYAAASIVMRCWLGLGLWCAMNNAEVAHLTLDVLDLDNAVIDFTRRKQGRIRRICPMPDLLVQDLRAYRRYEPAHADDAALVFITRSGNGYAGTRRRDGKPSDMISRMFRELMAGAGVELRHGRNFSGLRTTHFNLGAGAGADYDVERKIIFGRAQGSIDLDHYLEGVLHDRLRHVCSHVYAQFSSPLTDAVHAAPAAAFAMPVSPDSGMARSGPPAPNPRASP